MRVIFEAIFGWLDLVINTMKPAIDEVMENPILRLMTLSATIGGAVGTIKKILKKL